MSTGYKITVNDGVYYLTFQIVGWVDIFTRKVYRDIALDSFTYCCENKGLQLFAWVIMSNHIHLLARSEKIGLSDIVRDFKNYSSRKFLEYLMTENESRGDWMQVVFRYHGKYKNKQTHQIWTHENHAEQVYSQKFMEQKIEYVLQNPVRADIVEKPEEYLYSSARAYASPDSLLPVIKPDLLWKTYS